MRENDMIDFFKKLEKFAKKEGFAPVLKSRTRVIENGNVMDSIEVEFIDKVENSKSKHRIKHGMTRRLFQVAYILKLNSNDLMAMLDCSKEDIDNLHRGRDVVEAEDVYKFCLNVMSNTSHRVSSDYIMFGSGNAFVGHIRSKNK